MKNRNSVTSVYSLDNQNIPLPKDTVGKIFEYSNLRKLNFDNNISGGGRSLRIFPISKQVKKTRKLKDQKKQKKHKKDKTRKTNKPKKIHSRLRMTKKIK